MSTSLIDQRIVELRLLGTPEQAEELAFLEDYQKWKAKGGLTALEHKRQAEKVWQHNNKNRLLRWKDKKV